MNLIVCIDDMGGISFGSRRCSRDSAVYADIKLQCLGAALCVNAYSAKQFEGANNLIIDENPAQRAGQGQYCFIENLPAEDCGSIETLILYRWNRRYPADNFLNIDLKNYKLISSRDFPGSSHESITKEVYVK